MPSSTRNLSVQIGQSTVTRPLLADIYKLWFNSYDEKLLVADQKTLEKWFMPNEDFDEVCRSAGFSVLEAAKSNPVPTTALLNTFSSPFDRLSLILLFDQLSRNIYRGSSASVVYSNFDNVAQTLSLQTISQLFSKTPPQNPSEIPAHDHESLVIKCNMGYRMWLLLPLMHSEDAALHAKGTEGYDAMIGYVKNLKPEAEDEMGRKFSAEELEGAVKATTWLKSFEERHRVIIDRFGRYPHRNKILGRESTREEVEYLEGGGETFGT